MDGGRSNKNSRFDRQRSARRSYKQRNETHKEVSQCCCYGNQLSMSLLKMRVEELLGFLQNLQARYSVETMVVYLRAPQPPMPLFDLNDQERRDLSAYVLKRFH